MPPDVNPDSAPSADEQRIQSDSLADDTANLSPEHEAYLKNPRMAEALKTLTGGTTEDDKSPEGDEQVEPVTTEGEPEAPEASADTVPVEEPPEPVATDETPPPAKPTPKAAAPTEDTSYPDAKETAAYSPNAQRRIQQLVHARKKAESELAEVRSAAQYKKDLDAKLNETGIKPEAFDEWMQLGVVVQTDPAAAAKVLGRLAKTLGYEPEPEKGTDSLDADLKALVDEDQMTEAAAKKVQATRKPVQAPPRSAPAATGMPLLTKKPEDGAQIMLRLDTEFAKKYAGAWDSMAAEVNTELTKYRGTPTHLWEQTIRDAVDRVVRRKPSTVSSTPDPVSRSSGGRSQQNTGNKPPTRESVVSQLSFIRKPG